MATAVAPKIQLKHKYYYDENVLCVKHLFDGGSRHVTPSFDGLAHDLRLVVGQFDLAFGKIYLATKFAFTDVTALHIQLVSQHLVEVTRHGLALDVFHCHFRKIYLLHITKLLK